MDKPQTQTREITVHGPTGITVLSFDVSRNGSIDIHLVADNDLEAYHGSKLPDDPMHRRMIATRFFQDSKFGFLPKN